MLPAALNSLRPATAAATSPTNQLISSGTTTPHSSNPSWVPGPSKSSCGFFSSLGIMTTSEEGRLYPRSLRAESVRDALLNVCDRLGITLICGANVASAFKAPEGWVLQIDRPARALKAKKHDDRKSELRSLRKALADAPRKNETLQAQAVIIATGGSPADIAEDVQSFPHTAASRPLPCVGIGLRRPDCAQDAGWPARPRPFDAHPQSRVSSGTKTAKCSSEPLAFRALLPLTSPVAFSATTRFCSTFSPTSPKTCCSICSTGALRCSAAFHPATPAGSTACLPRNSPASSARRSSSAIQAPTMSSTWSRSSSTLRCSSRERAEERSAQVTRGGVPIESVSAPNLLREQRGQTPHFTSVARRSTSMPIAAAFNLAWAWISGIRAASSL